HRDAADDLGPQLAAAAGVEQTHDRARRIGAGRAGQEVLTGSEQAEAQRPPDAARTVDRPGTDRAIDSQPLEEADGADHDHAGHRADDHGPQLVHPVTGTGTATRRPRRPLMVMPMSHLRTRGTGRPPPPAAAASVVLVAMRPMPPASRADSVEPGLNSYQPN